MVNIFNYKKGTQPQIIKIREFGIIGRMKASRFLLKYNEWMDVKYERCFLQSYNLYRILLIKVKLGIIQSYLVMNKWMNVLLLSKSYY